MHGTAPGSGDGVDDDTRLSYDAVADDHARQLPGLDAETALDVAVLHDFADRSARRPAVPGPGAASDA